jgi:two-component system, NtrC family, response regulator HydG
VVGDSEEEPGNAGSELTEGNPHRETCMKVNILLIDNEESIRFSFSKFLAAEGHNVIAAKGYREALARMGETAFDLILTEVFLEDGWGMDVLREVNQRNLKTRVIIMTAYPSVETAQNSFRMRALDYLVKPLDQAGLIDSVNKALQH